MMRKILLLLLVVSMCLGLWGCDKTQTNPTDTTDDTFDTAEETTEEEEIDVDKRVMLVCSFRTNTYDLAEVITGRDHQVSKDGVALEGTKVKLDVGVNVFYIVYKVSGIERTAEVRIARREGHRVVFNTNGGNFIDTVYVPDGTCIDASAVTPTRNRYTFAGWYDEKGNKVTLSTYPIIDDTTLIARWNGPNTFEMPSKTPITYTTSSAALNINWKDYDNAFKLRPEEVLCELKDTATGTVYNVKVTKNSASFVGASPAGASIAQGAGNWTVKITGLTGNYSFVQKSLGTSKYTTTQSGTTVINTVKYYDPQADDTTVLMTENGRFYDIAGNVVVLKGVVPWNVDNSPFEKGTSTASLERLKAEGCTAIRITVPLGPTSGYQNVSDTKKATYVSKMKGAVERASALGIYCIVDWGVMSQDGGTSANNEYLQGLLEPAKDFFGQMSKAFADNPYIIYELANEPNASWTVLKEWEEALIKHIRANDVDARIIAAPTMHSRRLSEDNAAKGNDPIDNPIATELSYNVAHTFHCYAYTTTYNVDYDKAYRDDALYGWRVCDAVINGLTIVITEFSPANASMSYAGGYDSYGLDADYMEANKWLNFILENDVNYTLFRYGEIPSGDNKVKAQFMFTEGNQSTAYTGKWTYDMLTASGKWYYDNVLHATGFIKAADFDYRYDYK